MSLDGDMFALALGTVPYEVLLIYQYSLRKRVFLGNSCAGAAAAGDAVTRVEIMVLRPFHASM